MVTEEANQPPEEANQPHGATPIARRTRSRLQDQGRGNGSPRRTPFRATMATMTRQFRRVFLGQSDSTAVGVTATSVPIEQGSVQLEIAALSVAEQAAESTPEPVSEHEDNLEPRLLMFEPGAADTVTPSRRPRTLSQAEREILLQAERHRQETENIRQEAENLRQMLRQAQATPEPVALEPIQIDHERMAIIRGAMVNTLRFLIPESQSSRAKSILIFGTILYDDLLYLFNENLKCPHVRLYFTRNRKVPKLTLPLEEYDESTLSNTVNDWLDNHGVDDVGQFSVSERKSWASAIKIMLRFYPSTDFLPEEQFRSSFWARLLDSTLLRLMPKNARSGPEFRMQDIAAYSVDSRVDYVVTLPAIESRRLVVLLVEACASRLHLGASHKDLGKLAVMMEACMMSNLSQIREARQQSHVIFGLLTSGVQMRLCCYSAYYSEEHGWTFVFQAPNDWFVDFGEPEVELYDDDAVIRELCALEFQPEIVLNLPVGPVPEVEPADIETSDRWESWGNIETMASCQPNLLAMDVLIPRIRRFMDVCDIIAQQAQHMSTVQLNDATHPDNEVFVIPERFRTHFPHSRSKPSTTSPGRLDRTPMPTGATRGSLRGQTQYIGAVAQALEYADAHNLECDKPRVIDKRVAIVPCLNADGTASSALVIKPFQEVELKCLKLLRTEPGIVHMFDWHQLEYPYIMYHLEYLSTELPVLRQLDFALPFFINMIFDALVALRSLASAHIIHRDISPGNFLYCPRDSKWKLTDFEYAVFHSDPDAPYIGSTCVGTEGFIAPESTNLCQYSHKSDMYSMARTVEELAVHELTFCFMVSEHRGIATFFNRCKTIIYGMMNKDPLKRPDLNESIQSVSEILGEYRAWTAAHPPQ